MIDEERRIKEILKTELNNAVWIGEYGDMAVSCKTKLGALRKFRKLMREDIGGGIAGEIYVSDVGIGWLRLPRGEDEEMCEWIIEFLESTPYPVFIYKN
jgi:hypothetical protein